MTSKYEVYHASGAIRCIMAKIRFYESTKDYYEYVILHKIQPPGFLLGFTLQHISLHLQLFLSFQAYTSYVTLFEPYLVTSVCIDLTLFKELKTAWKFSDGTYPIVKRGSVYFTVPY